VERAADRRGAERLLLLLLLLDGARCRSPERKGWLASWNG